MKFRTFADQIVMVVVFVFFIGALALSCGDSEPSGADFGAGDGDTDGDTDGDSDGDSDGDTDGDTDGDSDGDSDADGGDSDDECPSEIQVTYYDFDDSHVDFGCAMSGSSITYGLVLDTLDEDRKPQYNPTIPVETGGSNPMITSADTFSQWFHEVPDVNTVSTGTISLTEDPPGSGMYVYASDDHVVVPGEGSFTTEIHSEFVYTEGQEFSFLGDDDVWVFIDNQLVVDIGGLHMDETGTANLDSLGLTPGETYNIDMFHAERCYPVSHFTLETSIDCFTPVVVE